MPKGRALKKKGGEFMIAELACGFVCRGSQQSVEKREKIHKRVCEECKNSDTLNIHIGDNNPTSTHLWRNTEQWANQLSNQARTVCNAVDMLNFIAEHLQEPKK